MLLTYACESRRIVTHVAHLWVREQTYSHTCFSSMRERADVINLICCSPMREVADVVDHTCCSPMGEVADVVDHTCCSPMREGADVDAHISLIPELPSSPLVFNQLPIRRPYVPAIRKHSGCPELTGNWQATWTHYINTKKLNILLTGGKIVWIHNTHFTLITVIKLVASDIYIFINVLILHVSSVRVENAKNIYI